MKTSAEGGDRSPRAPDGLETVVLFRASRLLDYVQLVECKNCSPRRYANGDIKVEVQKTRATQGDPAGRLYRLDQFDVVAACLFAPTGSGRHPDRLAPLQRVTEDGSSTLPKAL